MRLARRVAEHYNRGGMRTSNIALDIGIVSLSVGAGGFVGRVVDGHVHWWNVVGLIVVTVFFGVNLGFYIATRDLLKRRGRR